MSLLGFAWSAGAASAPTLTNALGEEPLQEPFQRDISAKPSLPAPVNTARREADSRVKHLYERDLRDPLAQRRITFGSAGSRAQPFFNAVMMKR